MSTPAAVATATAMPTVMYDAAGHPTATPTPPSVEPVAHDSAGPVPTLTPTAVRKEKEKESLPGHHHEHFDHEYTWHGGLRGDLRGARLRRGRVQRHVLLRVRGREMLSRSARTRAQTPRRSSRTLGRISTPITRRRPTQRWRSFFPTRGQKHLQPPVQTSLLRGELGGVPGNEGMRGDVARVSTSTNKRAPACFTACGMGAGATAAWAQTRVRSRSR